MSVNLAAGGYRVAMREVAIVVSELVKIGGGNEPKHYRAVSGGRQGSGFRVSRARPSFLGTK